MRLDTRAFAFAAGMTAAVLFVLCAAAVAVAPGATAAFFGFILHMDLSTLTRSITLGSFVGGLIAWTAGTALTFGLAAAIYNRLIARGATAPASHPAAAQHA